MVQHNTQMPPAVFSGKTPDEMYIGPGVRVPIDLAAGRARARAARLKSNKALPCAGAALSNKKFKTSSFAAALVA